jgi:internalin A
MSTESDLAYQEALRRIEVNFRTKATKLELSDLTFLIKMPPEIGKLTQLQTLYLSGTQISGINLDNLSNLKYLDLNGTQISEINLDNLSNLLILDLSDTNIDLPPELINNPKNPKAIIAYLSQQSKQPLNEIKMLILGEGTVGKTSLIKRLKFDEYDEKEGKTRGVDIYDLPLKVKNCDVKVNVWDFAGQEITHSTHQFFLTKRSLYLLVLANRKDEKGNNLEDWLKVIKNFGGDSPIIIVCNKADEHKISLNEATLKEKYPNIKHFIHVSCRKGTNIKKLKSLITQEIKEIPHVFENYPKKWVQIKDKLQDIKQNYIPYEDYTKICDNVKLDQDQQELLIEILHDLGVVLNFRKDKTVNDTNVLNPEWITDAVYRILTNEGLEKEKGVLTFERLDKILDNRRFPKQKHKFILDLMRKFERCFRLPETEHYLVPKLLPVPQPVLSQWKKDDIILGFQYKYEITPDNFMTRFIVRKHYLADNETWWRTGILLKNVDNNYALIKTDLADKTITVQITGKKETCRGFLSTIRGDFDEMHKKIEHLVVTEYVEHEKGLILYESLLKLEKKGIKTHYFPDIDAEIDVIQLLNGIESEYERKERAEKKEGKDYYMPKNYDIAVSFAGEQRSEVESFVKELKKRDISVFYDFDLQADLLGKDLYVELADVYCNRAKYVIVFVSEDYAKKIWTKHEIRNAFERQIQKQDDYIIPAIFDDTKIDGLRSTIGNVDLRKVTMSKFAELIEQKLNP